MANVKAAFDKLEKLVRDFYQCPRQEKAIYSEKVRKWRTLILVSLKYLQCAKI